MRKLVSLCILGAFAAGDVLYAQDKELPEKVRNVCSKADPKNKCTPPGPDCICVGDTLEIVLEGTDDSTLEIKDFAKGQKAKATIIMDVKSPDTPDVADVQGWSYGVIHDDTVLMILDATTGGTDAEAITLGKGLGFDATSHINIVTCQTNDAKCPNPKDGGGFISAVVLSLKKPLELPTGKRSSIAFAQYETLGKDVPQTSIEFSDRMAAKGSPPAALNITIAGNSRLPENVIDGTIAKEGVGPGEDCDNTTDDDGDGLIDCLDVVDCPPGTPPCPGPTEDCDNTVDDDGDGLIDCLDVVNCPPGTPPCPALACDEYAFYFGPAAGKANVDVGAGKTYVISMRNAKKSSGFQLGVKATKSGAQTGWAFSSTLGADNNRLIELLIADEDAAPHTPVTPNQATSNESTVTDIQRGTAIQGFSNDDFFAFDLTPGVGGPGFTVGYVADTNPPQGQAGNLIPATGTGAPCPVNEILRVTLGGTPGGANFNRGDADGNGRFNIIDPILIIQIRVGNVQERFDCDKALDANDDGTLNTADAVYLLNYIFKEGPPPPAPFRACGQDLTADALTCTASNCQ